MAAISLALLADDTLRVVRRIGDEPATELAPVGRADNHRVAAVECALDARHTGRQQALARSQRLLGAGVDVDVALRARAARRSSACARSRDRRGRGTTCTARLRRSRAGGAAPCPLVMTMCVPAASAIFAASILVFMPPFDSSVPASPAIASISGVIAVTTSRMLAARVVAAGRRGVEPVDVGEQHQAVGAHHGGDARRQAVVVAVADLGGRDRVVLVDDGQRAERQQRLDGVARVEVAAALLGVAERQRGSARR